MAKIKKFDIKIKKEVELNSNLEEIGEKIISVYLEADNGMSFWICNADNKQDILDFINPLDFVDNLCMTLDEIEMHIVLEALDKVPYYFDGIEYFTKES